MRRRPHPPHLALHAPHRALGRLRGHRVALVAMGGHRLGRFDSTVTAAVIALIAVSVVTLAVLTIAG